MSLLQINYNQIKTAPLNIKDYGAIGDGVTNDTTAWISFITDCASNSKAGYIPSGTYLIDPFTFTETHSGMMLFGETYGRNGISPGVGGVPAGAGIFGVSPTELRCTTAGTAFITLNGVLDFNVDHISLDGQGLVDDVLYFTGVSNNAHGQWNNSFFRAAKATTGNIHHYGGASGGEGWTFFQCVLQGTFPNVDANNPATCVYIENSNAFLGTYESCVFSNVKTALVKFSQGAANLINCEFYSANSTEAHISIINGGQAFLVTNPYTEQSPNVPFFKQTGTIGTASNRPIVFIGIQNSSVNSSFLLNGQQPVHIYGGFMGSGNIDLTPFVSGAITYGIYSSIVDGILFTTGDFTGTGVATMLTTRGCSTQPISAVNMTPSNEPNGAIIQGLTAGLGNNAISTNTAFGKNALKNITTGTDNTSVGFTSNGDVITTGSRNSIFGSSNADSGAAVTGDGNTLLGRLVARFLTSGSNNTCVGVLAGTAGSPSGQITTASNQVCIGDNNVTNAFIKVAWTVTSDSRDKTDIKDIPYGLNFIDQLKPVMFKFDDRSRYWIKNDDETYDTSPQPNGTKVDEKDTLGFIAQDIIKLETATSGACLIADNSNPELLRITETKLIPVLVKAIQELKAEIELLKAK